MTRHLMLLLGFVIVSTVGIALTAATEEVEDAYPLRREV